MAESSPEWVIGFEDETWWSRLARPNLHAWSAEDQNLRLIEQSVPKEDKSPKAVAAYRMLLRYQGDRRQPEEQIQLRFIQGQPVSLATQEFLKWCCERIQALGKKTLLLIWDNATWHRSQAVEKWIGEHNQQIKNGREGVRIIKCALPYTSPWLNPIELHWIHAKRQVVEKGKLLTCQELMDRVNHYFDSMDREYLVIPEYVF